MPPQHNPLQLRRQVVGPWSLNSYAAVCPQTRHSLLIDPGGGPDKLMQMLADSHAQAIVVTHGHPDHIGALDTMRHRLGLPVMAFSGHGRFQVTRALQHGQTIALGRHLLRVYHTPGHTADQICLGFENDSRFIVGDTIFEGGPGRTQSAQDFKQTLVTLRDIILAWPDEAVCYPGHGPAFRLGDKRSAIQAFLDKDHGDFCGDATWEMA